MLVHNIAEQQDKCNYKNNWISGLWVSGYIRCYSHDLSFTQFFFKFPPNYDKQSLLQNIDLRQYSLQTWSLCLISCVVWNEN